MDEGAGELFLAEKSSPAPSRSPTPSKNFALVRALVPVAVSPARPSFPHHPAGTRNALHCQSPGQPGEHQAGRPYPLVVPHSGKIFEPFLPPLSPDRPRPAGTSTPSAAFLSPQSGVFPITCPLPVVMTGLVAPSGNLRKRPAFPEGHPSIPFSGTSRCPHLQTAAGPVVHTRTSFFRGWGLEKGTVLPQNAPSPTRNPLPIPRSTMLSCGRSKLCETRPSARCARLFCC